MPRMARRRPSRSTASEPGSPETPTDAAWTAALRHLARAPRTAAEVSAHLERRGTSPEIVVETLGALARHRYLDDDALAARRAEELLLRRGCGRLRVAHELTRRGLTDSVVGAAITAVLEGTSEEDLARAALRRRFRDALPATPADRARAYRFLVGRGHPAEIVSAMLEEGD